MQRRTNKAATSKHLGTLGATPTGNATHGAPLVYQVLQGFSYDQDTKRDRQEMIAHRINQLTEDITQLVEALDAYAAAYDGMPQPVVARVAALGQTLTDSATAFDPTCHVTIEALAQEHAKADASDQYGMCGKAQPRHL